MSDDYSFSVDIDLSALDDIIETLEEDTLSGGCPRCGSDRVDAGVETGEYMGAVPVAIHLRCGDCGWGHESTTEVAVERRDEG